MLKKLDKMRQDKFIDPKKKTYDSSSDEYEAEGQQSPQSPSNESVSIENKNIIRTFSRRKTMTSNQILGKKIM